MANPSISAFCAHLMIMAALLTTTSTFVHSRGLSGLEETCSNCYREIGRTVWELVTGEPDRESMVEDDIIDSDVAKHSNGLVALLMGREGRQPREDLECSVCWVIAHRLKKKLGTSKALGGGYESFRKRAMLNNGWV